MSNETTIHLKNKNILMTEIYNFLNNFSPPIMNDIFQKQENHYSLRNPRSLVSKQKFTTTYGIDTISFRGPQIWQDLPQEIRNSDSLNLFKSNIKRYGHCKNCVKILFLAWVKLINHMIIKYFYYLQLFHCLQYFFYFESILISNVIVENVLTLKKRNKRIDKIFVYIYIYIYIYHILFPQIIVL